MSDYMTGYNLVMKTAGVPIIVEALATRGMKGVGEGLNAVRDAINVGKNKGRLGQYRKRRQDVEEHISSLSRHLDDNLQDIPVPWTFRSYGFPDSNNIPGKPDRPLYALKENLDAVQDRDIHRQLQALLPDVRDLEFSALDTLPNIDQTIEATIAAIQRGEKTRILSAVGGASLGTVGLGAYGINRALERNNE